MRILKASCYELFDRHDVTFDDVTAHAHDHGVAITEFVLEMLRTSEAPQSTIDHDGQPRAQHFTFLHADNDAQHTSLLNSPNAKSFALSHYFG